MTRERIVKLTGIITLCLVLLPLLFTACIPKRGRAPYPVKSKTAPAPKMVRKELKRMGYTIQAGAFANANNAVRLTELLQSKGVEATYFAARTGLYKVRLGNFTTKKAARARAATLQASGVITDFYIVAPEEYSVVISEKYGTEQASYLRDEIVKAAESFINVPYLWGGTSSETGFDCSGLTMTVYQLNGLNLPRNSAEQYDAGNPVSRENLVKGDLVFFSTNGSGHISHVGIYVGDGEFIHAPKKGKTICRDSLAEGYYAKHFISGCSYL
jgi:hypothetical protein